MRMRSNHKDCKEEAREVTVMSSVCLTLLTFSLLAYANGSCDLDGQWYDSQSSENTEVSVNFSHCDSDRHTIVY